MNDFYIIYSVYYRVLPWLFITTEFTTDLQAPNPWQPISTGFFIHLYLIIQSRTQPIFF